MKSLRDFFFEDEDKFVNIEYKTTTTDDVNLAPPVYDKLPGENDNLDDSEPENDDILSGGANLKLVGEIRLYSETSEIFKERKRRIAEAFKEKVSDESINANRIKYTKIFEYYINHLIYSYKKDVDNNCRLNISSKEELKRQLANDIVLIIRNMEVINEI